LNSIRCGGVLSFVGKTWFWRCDAKSQQVKPRCYIAGLRNIVLAIDQYMARTPAQPAL
jgi:hypothetical protein